MIVYDVRTDGLRVVLEIIEGVGNSVDEKILT